MRAIIVATYIFCKNLILCTPEFRNESFQQRRNTVDTSEKKSFDDDEDESGFRANFS
jgi:hypothetical protein